MKLTKNKVVGGLLALSLSVALAGATQLNFARAASIDHTGNSIVTMENGAYVRITDANKSGIRFVAKVDKDAYDALIQEYGKDNVKAGMVIVPEDYAKTAGGMTLDKLSTLDKEILNKTTDTFKLSEDENYYEFYASIIDLKDGNYTRDFCATAYVEVNTTATISGYSAYNSKQYAYSAFTETNNSRNIYTVANAAYNDRKVESDEKYANQIGETYSPFTQEKLDIIDNYLDEVAAVNSTGSTATMADDGAYYESPYTLTGADGEYILKGTNGKAPTGILYNGERVTNGYVKDSNVHVAVERLNKGTKSGANITLENGYPANTNPDAGNFGAGTAGETGYYAYEGEYGVGQFLDIEFTGNNMPYITFFADNVNGVVDKFGGSGLMIVNGMVSGIDSAIHSRKDVFRIYTARHNQNYEGATATTGELAKMTQAALGQAANTNYKLTVGTTEKGGKVAVYLKLVNRDTNAVVAETIETTTVTASTVQAGSIILHGCMKGNNTTTEFTTSAPYVKTDLPTILKGYLPNNANGGNLNSNEYVVVGNQKYGLGTYVDFTFTGNNMPALKLMASEANGTLSTASKGIILTNGIVTNNDGNPTTQGAQNHDYMYKMWGPNGVGSVWEYNSTSNVNGVRVTLSNHAFTQKMLDATANYKYTVGVLATGNGVWLDITLTNLDTNVVVRETLNTKITIDELKTALGTEATAQPEGYIVALACMKGENTVTKFNYGTPENRAGNGVILSDGATFNANGSVTLAGVYPNNGQPGTLCLDTTAGQSNNLVAYEKQTGVGTYMEFTFTGKNMPNVVLFSDDISRNITNRVWNGTDYAVANGNHYGYLLLNGMKSGGGTAVESGMTIHQTDGFSIWGVNRLNGHMAAIGNGSTLSQSVAQMNSAGTAERSNWNADLVPFQLSSLDDTHEYRYIVGTYVHTDGKVYIDLTLVDVTKNATYAVTVSTNKTLETLATALGQTGSDPKGYIVAYAAYKGSTSEHTTFTASELLSAKPTV